MPSRPNLLMIVMDCVRFDFLSAYGFSAPTTPNLERLAADGVVFENAFAAAPWTPPSHASLFTGALPSRHGVDVNENLQLNGHHRTLAEMLAAEGYRTLGVLPDVHLSSVRGFDRGFRDTVELWKIPYLHADRDWLECMTWNLWFGRDKMARYSNRVIRRWLDANAGQGDPFFVFLNYKTAHNGYQPPRPFRRRFEKRAGGIDREKVRYYSRKGGYPYMAGGFEMTEEELALVRSWYAGAVAYLDSRIGELVSWLRSRGLYDDTMIVVTADHGENLGEHRLAYHMFSLHDTLLHVPLIVSCPTRIPRGKRIGELVSLVDVMPTVLDVAGIDGGAAVADGRSLAPFDDRPVRDSVVAEFGRPHYMLQRLAKAFPGYDFSSFDRGLRCIRTKGHKLVVATDGREELFDVVRDPGETRNAVADLPDVAARLRVELERWRSGSVDASVLSPTEEDDEAVAASLRELGYF